jgi:hypothetical protein
MPKPMFETSQDVQKLIEYLNVRDRATYDEMNQHLGRKINGRDRHILSGALYKLQRERDMVFVCERGVGVVRATNGQVAVLSTDVVLRKTGRIIRRGKKLQPIVNTQALTGDERDAFYIGRATTQMLDATIGRKMRSKIAEEIRDRGEAVDIADVVALFRKRAH